MEILRTISIYAESNDKQFILIGGHAFNYHGLSRQTGDVDLIVKLTDSDWWKSALDRLKYTIGQTDDRFARFRPAELGEWPIDLMFVDDNTFRKLFESSVKGNVGVAEISIVSPRHLLTLKLHALKHYQESRYAKDYNDVLWLLRSAKVKITEDELAELCEKYANQDLFTKLRDNWDPK